MARNPSMDTFAGRLRAARLARGLSQIRLARAAGLGQSDVSKLERGKMHSTTAIARLSAVLDVPPLWLEQDGLPAPDFVTGITVRATAQVVPLLLNPGDGLRRLDVRATVAPQELNWGDLMGTEELPDSFTLPVAGQPLRGFALGERLLFSRSARPVAGKPVLIVDGDGNYFLRRYVERRPGQWRAVADEEGLDALDPAQDGISIVAAAIGSLWGP